MASKDENQPSRMKTDVSNTFGSAHYQTLRSDSSKQVLVMDIPSDSPELGIYTATMQQNKEWTSNLRRNMQLCHEAVTLQSAFCHHLQRTNLPETSYMFLLEKSMMDMVVSELSEGCVYGVVFRQGRMHYLRFLKVAFSVDSLRAEHIMWSHRIKYSYDNAIIMVGQNSSIWTRIRLENPAGKFEQEYHPVSN